MPHHIFTYGSLMFPQVWQHAVYGRYRSTAATVAGYARYTVSGETYPALIAQNGAAVPGVLYFDVGADDVARLDSFEGAEYRRESLMASTGAGGVLCVEAYLYLCPEKLSKAVWQPDAFQLQQFLARHCPAR